MVEAYQIAHKNVRLSMGGGMTDKGYVDKGKVGGNKSGGSVVQAKSQVICYYCDREGHISRDCPVNQHKGGKPGGHPGKKMDKVGMCVSSENSLDGTRRDVIGERYAVSEIIRLPGVGNGSSADLDSQSVPGLDVVKGSVCGREAVVLRIPEVPLFSFISSLYVTLT